MFSSQVDNLVVSIWRLKELIEERKENENRLSQEEECKVADSSNNLRKSDFYSKKHWKTSNKYRITCLFIFLFFFQKIFLMTNTSKYTECCSSTISDTSLLCPYRLQAKVNKQSIKGCSKLVTTKLSMFQKFIPTTPAISINYFVQPKHAWLNLRNII